MNATLSMQLMIMAHILWTQNYVRELQGKKTRFSNLVAWGFLGASIGVAIQALLQ